MADDQEKYSFIKEMLIAFIGGGALGLVVLVAAIALVEHLKR
ncbi:hypothetical protein SBDP1_80035 [Syntrophobacter sp. SbD1]|nr:hypothetical protein SBDP1_80035 [Syntrophobacter sp. SbD1]